MKKPNDNTRCDVHGYIKIELYFKEYEIITELWALGIFKASLVDYKTLYECYTDDNASVTFRIKYEDYLKLDNELEIYQGSVSVTKRKEISELVDKLDSQVFINLNYEL